MSLERLSSSVYILPAHPDDDKVQPVIGAVLGKNETILIDAGNSPRHALEMLTELNTLAAPPVKQIIYTHWHWDHIFGSCVFDVPVIAHHVCKEKLLEEASKLWGENHLAEEVTSGRIRAVAAEVIRAGIRDWTTFKIVIPTQSFEHTYTLEGAGYCLELHHVSSKHSPDSIIVNVVGEDIMFVADAFYPAPLRLEPNDQTLDVKVLEFMLASSCSTFVHGHGEVLRREAVREILEESA